MSKERTSLQEMIVPMSMITLVSIIITGALFWLIIEYETMAVVIPPFIFVTALIICMMPRNNGKGSIK